MTTYPSARGDDPAQPDLDARYHREVYDGERLAEYPEIHSRGLDFGLLVLRLASLALLPHGVRKAIDMPAFVDEIGTNPIGSQAPELFAWMVMIGQVALPVLIAIGLFTRPAGFVVAAMMIAIWALAVNPMLVGAPVADQSGGFPGEAAVLYALLALPLAFTGAGRWSLDSMRTGGRP